MKCKYCKVDLDEGQKYCPNCGEKVVINNDMNTDSVPLKDIIHNSDIDKEDMNEQMFQSDESILSNKKIKKIQRRVGFKTVLIVAFIAFFFPYCTVSCGNQNITTPTGYEMTYNFGLSLEQLHALEIDTNQLADPIIAVVLVVMFCGILISGNIVNTLQSIIAFGLLILFNYYRLEEMRNGGLQVEIRFGYWLALIALLLGATASFWSTWFLNKVERIVRRGNSHIERSSFYNIANIITSILLAIVVLIAIVTNSGMIQGISKSFSQDGIKSATDYATDTNEQYQNQENENHVETSLSVESSSNSVTDLPDLTLEDMFNNSVYLKDETGFRMILGRDNSGSYLQFFDNSGILWTGTPASYASLENGGLMVTVSGYDYAAEAQSQLEIRWDAAERVTHPVIKMRDSLGDSYSGQYTYSHILTDEEKNMNAVSEGDASDEYILPDSSTRYLDVSEVNNMSKDELRLARNEIYAKHGRLFSSQDLIDYFNSMSWYNGYILAEEFDDSVLNEYEKANLELIKNIEGTK